MASTARVIVKVVTNRNGLCHRQGNYRPFKVCQHQTGVVGVHGLSTSSSRTLLTFRSLCQRDGYYIDLSDYVSFSKVHYRPFYGLCQHQWYCRPPHCVIVDGVIDLPICYSVIVSDVVGLSKFLFTTWTQLAFDSLCFFVVFHPSHF